MNWEKTVDRAGVWLVRSGAERPLGFARYTTLVVAFLGERGPNNPGRFIRLVDDGTWSKIEHLHYPPETVYAFVESLHDSAEVSGWRLTDHVACRR